MTACGHCGEPLGWAVDYCPMCGGRLADLAKKPPPPEHEYYLLTDGQPQGPYPQAQILDWIAARHIGPASLGWRAGLGEWMPLDEMPELAEAFGSILPTPTPVSPD